MAIIKIDGQALKEWATSGGKTMSGVSADIGRNRCYIINCARTGQMQENAYRLLLEKYGLPEGSFRPVEKPAPPVPANGIGPYQVSLEVYPQKVRFGINFNGQEVYYAFAGINGERELDLIQSISYAAHMVYKIAQQLNCRPWQKTSRSKPARAKAIRP